MKPSIFNTRKVWQAFNERLFKLEVPLILISSIIGHNVISSLLIVVFAKLSFNKRAQFVAATLPKCKQLVILISSIYGWPTIAIASIFVVEASKYSSEPVFSGNCKPVKPVLLISQ